MTTFAWKWKLAIILTAALLCPMLGIFLNHFSNNFSLIPSCLTSKYEQLPEYYIVVQFVVNLGLTQGLIDVIIIINLNLNFPPN